MNGETTGVLLPPSSGRKAIRAWYLLPSVFPISVVSEPTYSPSLVASRSWTPTPRARVGFQVYAIPLTGLSAAIPSRATAPWSAMLRPIGLFCQLW